MTDSIETCSGPEDEDEDEDGDLLGSLPGARLWRRKKRTSGLCCPHLWSTSSILSPSPTARSAETQHTPHAASGVCAEHTLKANKEEVLWIAM